MLLLPEIKRSGGARMTTKNETFRQNALAAALALVAGYSDAYLFINYNLYASFMSGNTTQTGLRGGQTNFGEAIYSFLPIPCFFAGIFVGTLIENTNKSAAPRTLLATVAALSAIVIGVEYLMLSHYLTVIVLSAAMGILNTIVTKVGAQAVSLGYVTGVLDKAAKHLAQGIKGEPVEQAQGAWDTHWSRVRVLLAVWTAFLAGAFVAGIIAARLTFAALLPPVLLLLLLTAFAGKRQTD